MIATEVVFGLAILFLMSVYGLIYYNRQYAYGSTKDGFLVSNRDLNPVLAAITAGTGWIWAPAFFLSSFQAYYNGLIGFFWFSVGNILTLILFSYGAQKIRDKFPNGYTLSSFIKSQYGTGLQKVYIAVSAALIVATTVTMVVALSKTLAIITGINQAALSVAIMAAAFLLSYRVGYRASVYSDMIKFGTIYLVLGSCVAYLLYIGTGLNLAGIKGHGWEFIGTPHAWMVFSTFGGAFFLSNLSTPWIDNGFTQTAYAVRDKKRVGQAFRYGALIFAGAIFLAGSIGFIGAAAGTVVVPKGNELYYFVYAIDQLIGRWALIPIIFMIFAALIAVIDGFIASISSIVGHDVAEMKGWNEKQSLQYARYSFIAFALIVILIANSGADILYLTLLHGMLKVTAGFTTAGMILNPKAFNPRVVMPVLLVSIVLATVSFLTASALAIPGYALYLSAFFCFMTPTTAYMITKFR